MEDDFDDALGWLDAACASQMFTPLGTKDTNRQDRSVSYHRHNGHQLSTAQNLQQSSMIEPSRDSLTLSDTDLRFSSIGLSSPSDARQVPQSLSNTQIDLLFKESQQHTAVGEGAVLGTKRTAENSAEDQENTPLHGTQPQPREAIIDQIEGTILSLLERVALGKQLGLPTAAAAQPSAQGRKALKSSRGTVEKRARSKNSPGAYDSSFEFIKRNTTKKFTRRLRVLQIMHESIVQNVVVSKRDIYYRDVELFETQKVVDDIVTGWSHCFNVPRSTLHVTASSKGLIYGAASITLKNGKKLDCTADIHTDDSFCSDEQGVLIPPVNQIARVESVSSFVLIIEKEASFRHLVSTGFARVFPNGILITGRGYPVCYFIKSNPAFLIHGEQDIATRHLLKYLSIYHETLPILAFVDYDPYGLEIYSVYKWGSRAQAFDAPNLAVPKVQHIGLTSKDRLKYAIPDQTFMPMTPRDRRKAVIMTSGRSETSSDGSSQLVQPQYHLPDQPSSYRSFIQEISAMLHLDLKCELQAFCHDSQFGMLDCLRIKISDSLKTAPTSA